MDRKAGRAALWAKIEARRAAFRRTHPVDHTKVTCPFSSDMKCHSGCTDNRDRACVNGED